MFVFYGTAKVNLPLEYGFSVIRSTWPSFGALYHRGNGILYRMRSEELDQNRSIPKGIR